MHVNFIIDKEYELGFAKDDLQKKAINELYDSRFELLKLTKELYQKYWNEIDDAFSKEVEKITNYSWPYERYDCVVTLYFRGFSNWGKGAKVAWYAYENPYRLRRWVAHEILLSNFFEIIYRHYKNENLTDNQIWALAEITGFCLACFTDLGKKFWPWDMNYHTNHNYPQIVELQNKLKPIFLERKDFKDYIEKCIKLVKEYPNIGPVNHVHSHN